MLRKPNSFGFNPARLVRLGGSSVRQTSDLEPKPTDFGRIGLQVTTSQIQDMAQFHDTGSSRRVPYALWKAAL